MIRFILLLLFGLLSAAPLLAQAALDDSEEELRQRITRLETELANLRDRVEDRERDALDAELRDQSLVQVYGDIGLRYHMLFESQTETFNRPEFRLHLGVFGTAFQQDEQLLRYDMRLTTSVLDMNGKPAPTLSWLPFPGYGSRVGVSFDRFLVDLELNRTLQVTLGRFPNPWNGTDILFDRDYHFQGLAESVRFDRFLPDAAARLVPRIQITSVQGYLAQNNLGLPSPTAETQPIYVGGQFRIDLAPFEQPTLTPEGTIAPEVNSEFELRLMAGLHWFDGEEGIASNLGVGYLDKTTNVLGADGLVHSEFLVAEVYTELVILRTRRARVKAWFHGLLNLHANEQFEGTSERNDQAFDAGISWGMERFENRWDFKFSFHYFYIEADSVIPEFNSEVLNTNIKGYEFALAVRVFPTLTVFGEFTVSERENYDLNGFGRVSKSDPNYASGQSTRIRIGIYLDF
ncbi:MAG: putative porin [Planctomycetes bacterium]|nr:putative porin [Planctomycetota bacterium]